MDDTGMTHGKGGFVRVIAVYLGAAWVVLQVAALLEEMLELPGWIDKGVFGLLLAGFPVIMLLAWVRSRRSGEGAEPGETSTAADATERDRPGFADGEAPTIAVLPFVNLSADEAQQFFADGVTEDLISGLSQSRQLRVTARSSSFRYKGESPDIREVGRDLAVRYVVEGSVRPLGSRIRVNVQLVEAATGVQLWAKKFDQLTDRLFDVQDEMIDSIAAALNAQLTTAEAARAAALKVDDLTSWQALQKSLSTITSSFVTRRTLDDAVARLTDAVARNPGHAYAQAALAWFLTMRVVNFCSADVAQDFRRAGEHLAHARSLMGDDPYALMLVGHALCFGGRFAEAIEVLQRAISLNPASTDPYPGLGLALGMSKDFEGAHACLAQARRLSAEGGFTVNLDWMAGYVFGVEGDFDAAMPLFEKVAKRQPMFPTIHVWLAVGHAMRGDERAAARSVSDACRASDLLTLDYLRDVPILHPDVEEHRRRVDLLVRIWPSDDTE